MSAETWLANVVASTGSCNALGLLSSFFFFHFTLVSAADAPGNDVRASHANALQMSHAMMLLLVSSTSGLC